MRRDALESRADRGMRAYVTGGWLRQLRRAPAARACALRHHATSHGELMARDTSGARVVRGMHRTLAASSGWDSDEGRRRLRCSAGAGRLVLRSIETGSAAIIVMSRTTMRREQRAFALLLLDRACTGRSDPRLARNRYAAAGAFSVQPEQRSSCSVLLGAHERERLRDRSPQIATQWTFAADRAAVIDSAVFGTAIAASARLATQTGMAPITSRASNDRNVGTEAPNGERDAHGQAT